MNEIVQGVIQSIISVFFATWWIVIPLILAFIFWDFWKYHVYIQYLRSQKWIVLEIKMPPNVEKTPKAMEQVFAAVYQIYSFGLKFFEKYWQGKLVEDFMSFELVGQAGGVHFYVRTLVQYRNLIESAIYAQYPEAEISEADDYRKIWPRTLPNEIYDIAGCDYQLAKEDAYPIRTYHYFEESQKEKRLDPISAITEVMSKLKDDEAIWIQIFVRPPSDNSWREQGQELLDALLGRKKSVPSSGMLDKLFHFFRNLITAPVEHPTWPEEMKKERDYNRMLMLTPGEREVVEAIEENLSRISFQTNMRFIYIDRRDSFSPLNVAATMSTFNQFNTQHLNSFMPKLKTFTLSPAGLKGLLGFIIFNVKFLKRKVIWYRKRRLWDNYMRLIWSPGKRSILNIEELATLYHVPSMFVEAPLVRRVGAKKGEPPAGLPVE